MFSGYLTYNGDVYGADGTGEDDREGGREAGDGGEGQGGGVQVLAHHQAQERQLNQGCQPAQSSRLEAQFYVLEKIWICRNGWIICMTALKTSIFI